MSSNQELPQAQPLSVEQAAADVVVVMVPYPAQGHLNQLLHLSRHILSHNIPVHFVSTATHNRQAKLRFHAQLSTGATNNIIFHDVPIPPYHSPPPDPTASVKFPAHLQPLFDAVRTLHAPVSDLLRTLAAEARKLVVINDSMMASVVREVGDIPNAVSFVFQSVSAFYCIISLWEYFGKPELQIKKERIPENIPSLDDCFTPDFWASIAIEIEHLPIHSGAIYNTSRLIEGDYLDYMEILEDPGRSKKNWALGPFNPPVKDDVTESNHFSIEWLDKQPENSVVYLSFGTTTAMAEEQIKEMAAGLKQSKQRFLWVVRDADKSDVFSKGEEEGARDLLPEGFEDSLMGLGLVIRDWAPQLEILAHRATGGFISHCGWNSCMESMSMGVPIGTWPMHSDQPRNAVLMTQVLKVGTVIRDWAQRHEVATTMEVEEAVRKLMEGEEVRKRAAELGRVVRESVEDGGVTRREFDSFINHVLA